MRLLVTGSRGWTDRRVLYSALYGEMRTHGQNAVLVHGDAAGVDHMARDIWREFQLRDEPHPARWRSNGAYNPLAGFDRNAEMVALGADRAFYFALPCASPKCKRSESHMTHGTEDCVRRIREAGIPLWGWGWVPR